MGSQTLTCLHDITGQWQITFLCILWNIYHIKKHYK